jgi:putative hydrolase of the HAD superfamily
MFMSMIGTANKGEKRGGPLGARSDSCPDFSHVRCWIFDLDNTLYPACNGIFAQIEGRMTDYVMRVRGLTRPDAKVVQKNLYRRYGTTLNGLMQEDGIDAEDYLAFVHDIDLSSLVPDAALAHALAALPGRRMVFTNGCANHAGRILDRLGLTDLFETVWDIRTIAFHPKPEASGYGAIVAAGGFAPQGAAMFDDIPYNLVPARALGMTTVWLKNGAPWAAQGPVVDVGPGTIDHQTDNLSTFLHTIKTTA